MRAALVVKGRAKLTAVNIRLTDCCTTQRTSDSSPVAVVGRISAVNRHLLGADGAPAVVANGLGSGTYPSATVGQQSEDTPGRAAPADVIMYLM